MQNCIISCTYKWKKIKRSTKVITLCLHRSAAALRLQQVYEIKIYFNFCRVDALHKQWESPHANSQHLRTACQQQANAVWRLKARYVSEHNATPRKCGISYNKCGEKILSTNVTWVESKKEILHIYIHIYTHIYIYICVCELKNQAFAKNGKVKNKSGNLKFGKLVKQQLHCAHFIFSSLLQLLLAKQSTTIYSARSPLNCKCVSVGVEWAWQRTRVTCCWNWVRRVDFYWATANFMLRMRFWHKEISNSICENFQFFFF